MNHCKTLCYQLKRQSIRIQQIMLARIGCVENKPSNLEEYRVAIQVLSGYE